VDAAARGVEIALGQCKGLAGAQPGTPEQHDECPRPQSVQRVAGAAHDRDQLLDGRRIGRVAQCFVAWRTPAVVAGHRGRRTAAARGVEQKKTSHTP
jgi:hypothetical protein